MIVEVDKMFEENILRNKLQMIRTLLDLYEVARSNVFTFMFVKCQVYVPLVVTQSEEHKIDLLSR